MRDLNEMPLSEILALAKLGQQNASPVWKLAYDSDGNHTSPHDERQVMVFLNGHVGIGDEVGRHGGGWGIRHGYYNHDRHFWFAGGERGAPVTHWCELPDPPISALDIPWKSVDPLPPLDATVGTYDPDQRRVVLLRIQREDRCEGDFVILEGYWKVCPTVGGGQTTQWLVAKEHGEGFRYLVKGEKVVSWRPRTRNES